MLLAAAGARGQQDALKRLEERVVEFNLPNGMKFLVVPERGAPVFSANVMFRAGGVDEVPGITGLAHMYEHVAFKGTKTIGTKNYEAEKPILDQIDEVAVPLSLEMSKGERADKSKVVALRKQLAELQKQAAQYVVPDELWDLYLTQGATGLNASTGKDVTQYIVSLPANRLELWMWLESDRMLNPVMREFYQERDVVAEERRLRVDTVPGSRLYQDFIATALIAHPARYMVIGWMSDILTYTRKDAEKFFAEHYSPGAAVAALAGDLDPDQVKALAQKYFGRIPAGPPPPPVRTVEPKQLGERRVQVVWDAQPDLYIAFHKPSPQDLDEEAVFEVIHGLLARGRSSRLYVTLVKEKQLATDVGSWSGPTDRYPNLFILTSTPRYPHTAHEVELAIYDGLEALAAKPPTDEELQKVRNGLRSQMLQMMQSHDGLAELLAYNHAVYGDWRYVLRMLERIDRVTADDVERVAQQYFTPTNRTVGEIVPAKKETGAAAPPAGEKPAAPETPAKETKEK
jgi:predicted Zn-dependent peptidase